MTDRTTDPVTHGQAFASFPAYGSPNRHAQLLQSVVAAFAIYALVGGLLAVVGWGTGIYRLTDWFDNQIAMKANTAVAAAAGGAALLTQALRRSSHPATRVLGALVGLIGGLTLLEHLTGWNLGIDTMLFDEPPGRRATTAPGRMGLPASTSFLLLGAALAAGDRRRTARRISAVLGLGAAGIASLSLTGYLYGADQMYALPRLTGIAVQTASMIFALGLGIVASHPEQQPMRTLLDPGAGGILMRRALPLVTLVPLGLGWIRIYIQQNQWVDTAFGTALRTLVEVGLLVCLLWWAAEKVRSHELRIQEGQQLWRTTLASVGDGVITSDTEGRVTFMNFTGESLTGWRSDQALGQPLSRVFHFVERNSSRSGVDDSKAFVGGGSAQLLTQDGTRRSIEGNVSPIRDARGKTVGEVSVFRDVTERKQAEEDLRKAEAQLRQYASELEARVTERTADLNATKEHLEAFVYSIAHDLRAPLRSMTGFSHLLLEDYIDRLDDTGKTLLQRIGASAKFMDQLLLDLLAFGRTARAEMELTPVEVLKAWNVAQFQVSTQVESCGAQIETIGSLPVVRAHEATLSQCLANLLSNALKFVAPGVQPQVRFWAEDRGVAADGTREGKVRLYLQDNGLGIAAEHHERVFRVFERLHGPRYSGTGIGLSIVRKGVERMGGDIGLKSNLNEGSVFWIELRKAG